MLPPENGATTSSTTTAAMSNGTADQSSSKEMEALCHELKAKVDGLLARDTAADPVLRAVQEQVRVANGVIEDALRRYRPEQLALSYNGGKDCLVLLILILAAFGSHFDPSSFPPALQALYIRPAKPFAEVDAFVAASARAYHLDLATSSNAGMRAALTAYLRESRPQVQAVFVGTRRTDPHGATLGFFDPTDPGWPACMRVHPVIDWHYREVWGFIRALQIPYCPLYDMGYTSLGGTDDTHPNPALRRGGDGKDDDNNHNTGFRPAYELMEDEEERLGRDR
ncbi:adenine nucleotide alpha hydrolases-like protein [Xylariomycetidae sp. FL0641]|nr:adenine nucleotide alpha hydrolases-like protein [Xylariomycetidae sp. FL0641]